MNKCNHLLNIVSILYSVMLTIMNIYISWKYIYNIYNYYYYYFELMLFFIEQWYLLCCVNAKKQPSPVAIVLMDLRNFISFAVNRIHSVSLAAASYSSMNPCLFSSSLDISSANENMSHLVCCFPGVHPPSVHPSGINCVCVAGK